MPSIFATMKWPNSCRMTAEPRMKTKARKPSILFKSLQVWAEPSKKIRGGASPPGCTEKVYVPRAQPSNKHLSGLNLKPNLNPPPDVSGHGLRALVQARDLGGGRGARLLVHFEHHVEVRHRPRLVRVHHALDDARDVRQAYVATEEGTDRLLVGGVHRRRERPARAQGAVGEAQARETFHVGRLEAQRPELRQIERRQRGRLVALRVRERVLDGVTHVGHAELRDDRAVHQLDHRVDDRL